VKNNCEADSKHWESFFSEMKDTLIFQMHRIHCVMFRVANRLIEEASVPVKMEQLPILMCIHSCGCISQQEIADMVHRDKSSVQRTVVVLEDVILRRKKLVQDLHSMCITKVEKSESRGCGFIAINSMNFH